MIQQSSGDNVSVAATDKADLSRKCFTRPALRAALYARASGNRVGRVDMLASGITEDKILHGYPYLEKADFPAVYAYASQTGREHISR
jgi:hypothetical protein